MAKTLKNKNMARVDGTRKSVIGHQGPIVYKGKTKIVNKPRTTFNPALKGEKYTKGLTVMTEKSLGFGGGKEKKMLVPGITKNMHPAELQYLSFTGKLSEGQKRVAAHQGKKYLNKGQSAFYPNLPLKRKK